MRWTAPIRGQLFLGLAVWLGTGLTLSMMGIGFKNLRRLNQSRCRVQLDLPDAVPMRRAQDPPPAAAEHAEIAFPTLDRLPEVAKGHIRIVPQLREDSVLGFVIAGAGLHNGDVIIAINGYDLTTPDKALRAYANLRRMSHYTVDIERGGQRMTLELNPVPAAVRYGSDTACPLRPGWDRGLRGDAGRMRKSARTPGTPGSGFSSPDREFSESESGFK